MDWHNVTFLHMLTHAALTVCIKGRYYGCETGFFFKTPTSLSHKWLWSDDRISCHLCKCSFMPPEHISTVSASSCEGDMAACSCHKSSVSLWLGTD